MSFLFKLNYLKKVINFRYINQFKIKLLSKWKIRKMSKIKNLTFFRNESTTEVIDETEMESNWDQVVESFDELNLKKELLRGIYF